LISHIKLVVEEILTGRGPFFASCDPTFQGSAPEHEMETSGDCVYRAY
jgi:hypothetical protein